MRQPGGAAGFVREARASDAPALARIQVASWQATLGGLVPAEVLAELSGEGSLEQFTERWRDSIASPPTSRHKVLVAYLPSAPRQAGSGAAQAFGDLAGFAAIGPATDEDRWPGTDGELYEFHLLPSQAGGGHGGRLLHAVADTLAEDGFQTACTWVLAEDSARAEFLQAAGWAPDGSQGNLDMGVKVPVTRLHTLLAGGTTPQDPIAVSLGTCAGGRAAGGACGSCAAAPARLVRLAPTSPGARS
jgi:GNAT superfamily N-acetyltransferase